MEIGGVPAGVLAVPEKIDPSKLDAAKDFIKFVISPDVQLSLAEKMYQTPSIEGVNMPATLKDFQFIGERMLLNIYGGEVDKNVTDLHHRYGQQFMEGKLSQDEYLAKIKDEMKKGVENYKKTNNWNKDNNYGIK
jgi:raffinose/stachyose/melibiose transport system substrate-binding protein